MRDSHRVLRELQTALATVIENPSGRHVLHVRAPSLTLEISKRRSNQLVAVGSKETRAVGAWLRRLGWEQGWGSWERWMSVEDGVAPGDLDDLVTLIERSSRRNLESVTLEVERRRSPKEIRDAREERLQRRLAETEASYAARSAESDQRRAEAYEAAKPHRLEEHLAKRNGDLSGMMLARLKVRLTEEILPALPEHGGIQGLGGRVYPARDADEAREVEQIEQLRGLAHTILDGRIDAARRILSELLLEEEAGSGVAETSNLETLRSIQGLLALAVGDACEFAVAARAQERHPGSGIGEVQETARQLLWIGMDDAATQICRAAEQVLDEPVQVPVRKKGWPTPAEVLFLADIHFAAREEFGRLGLGVVERALTSLAGGDHRVAFELQIRPTTFVARVTCFGLLTSAENGRVVEGALAAIRPRDLPAGTRVEPVEVVRTGQRIGGVRFVYPHGGLAGEHTQEAVPWLLSIARTLTGLSA